MCVEKRVNTMHTCGHENISSTYAPYITACRDAAERTPLRLPMIPCHPHLVNYTTVHIPMASGVCRTLAEETERRKKEQEKRGNK
jgi:hypothetical protein